MAANIDPIIWFFLFGLISGLLKSELRLPNQIYDLVSMLLLLTIGLKGGIELAKQPAIELLPQIGVIMTIGFILPLVVFPVLRVLTSLSRADSASIAAHYGSVSVGTFAVAVAYLSTQNIDFEQHMALFVVVLEIPAILVGIVLAKGLSNNVDWKETSREVFLGKGVLLLIGGLLIGWVSGEDGLSSVSPLFFDLFKGVLALFLLEMGIIAAAQFSTLKRHGVFLLAFGTVVPIVFALIGVFTGALLGFSPGGTAILATLFASSSYIAVPAAMRISVPEANPTLSLTASLGVTFPFNIIIGIPLYTSWAHSALI